LQGKRSSSENYRRIEDTENVTVVPTLIE